jgi:hypothetical protein
VTIASFTRWPYRGRHSNWIARVVNGMGAAVASIGITAMVTLEVIGRRSGRMISLPWWWSWLLNSAIVSPCSARMSSGPRTSGPPVVELPCAAAIGSRSCSKALLLISAPSSCGRICNKLPGARPQVPVSKDAPLADVEQAAPAYPSSACAHLPGDGGHCLHRLWLQS